VYVQKCWKVVRVVSMLMLGVWWISRCGAYVDVVRCVDVVRSGIRSEIPSVMRCMYRSVGNVDVVHVWMWCRCCVCGG